MGSPRPHQEDEAAAVLREPKGAFQEVVRRLAEAAMACTHHDASPDEPGYIHEVQSMERKFTSILRGKLKIAPTPQPKETRA